MSTSWEYAKWAQKVHEYGGPVAYDKARLQTGYNAGYVDGKTEGVHKGILYMLPLALVSCSYLVYDKWPIIWNKIRIKMYLATKKELTEKAEQKNLSLELACPICGKKASGIDEVIKLFGFDKADNGQLIRREVCRECWDRINDEE